MSNPVIHEDVERILATMESKSDLDQSTIVVTGCAGFIGFYLMQTLVTQASVLRIRRVIGLDTFLLGEPPWLAELAAAYPTVLSLHKFDVSKDDIAGIAGTDDARYVVHGASIASPTFYRMYPVETVDANIWGLRRLLDFYRGATFLKGFLFFSSSEIYGDPDPKAIPTSEDYPGLVSCNGPRACYDESKRFGETLCSIYSAQFGMPITIARPFNNYGPGMRLDDRRLPADFAKCIVDGRDLTILSDGKPTRTFCYITDAVAGYFKCMMFGRYDYFNIGIEKPEITVRQLAAIYRDEGARIFNYTGAVHYETSDDPDYMTDNPNRRCPVIEKARRLLGYNPEILVEEGVARYLRFLQYEQNVA